MYVTIGLKQCSEWVGKHHTAARKCNIVDTDDHRHHQYVAAAYKNKSGHGHNNIPIKSQTISSNITTHFNNILLSS
jgi:hypothetical protein